MATPSVPSFTPEFARTCAEVMLQGLENEAPVTRKVIAAVTKPDFKLDPKSTAALDLAWHIVVSEFQFLDWIATGKMMEQETVEKMKPASIAGVIKWHEENLPKAIAKIRAMPSEKLAAPLNFANVFNYPAFIYLNFANNHNVHHRGQLSAYLRPMGSKVPQIYGGSADEPWQPPA